ncbi:MAG: glycosyltransferase family 2 protein [Thermoguttaceae bacterium]
MNVSVRVVGREAGSRTGAAVGEVRKAPNDPAVVSVIVPVYNEAATIGELIRRVLEAPDSKQIIVVDDGSLGQTPDVLARVERSDRIIVLRHDGNRGKGAAIRTGLEHARARFTSFRMPIWSTIRRNIRR